MTPSHAPESADEHEHYDMCRRTSIRVGCVEDDVKTLNAMKNQVAGAIWLGSVVAGVFLLLFVWSMSTLSDIKESGSRLEEKITSFGVRVDRLERKVDHESP